MSRLLLGRMRRPSWPALTWLGVLLAALVAGTVLAVHSDSANTDVRTAADQPKPFEGPLASPLSSLWSSDDTVDDQRTVASNTVITSSEHGVRGLDPQSGDERWHYLRSNATMCDLTVLDDVVVAIFRTTGRCNEAVALEAGSGLRRWYRNVGFSDRLSLFGSGTAAVASTPDGIAVLDAVGNAIRWRYNPPQGCEVASIAVGVNGVVVLESCTTGTTWLAEFDLYSGDQQWRVAPPPGEVSVLGSDGVVSLLVGQELLILSVRDGSLLSNLGAVAESGSVESSPSSAVTTFVGQAAGQGTPLVYLSGTLYAIDPTSGAQLWSVTADGLPADNGDAGIVVFEAGDFVTRDPLSGLELSRSDLLESTGSGGGGLEGLTRIERAGSVLIADTDDGLIAYG